jgi:predicted RNA-binding Zn-ribbon protein involved in translation (DUF1610 family)
MAKRCLYCGLQLPESAEFCPECGRPRERSFKIRPIQESELDYPRKEMKGTDDLLRQQGFSSDRSDPLAHMEANAHPGKCPKCGAHLAERDRNTTGTLSTRKFSWFQSKQSMRSRVRRVRAASALRKRARSR